MSRRATAWICAASLLAGCQGDDSNAVPATDAGASADVTTPPVSKQDAGAPSPSAGSASAAFSSSPIDFGSVSCGAAPATQAFSIAATGSGPLVISATTTGAAFSVTPSALSIASGETGSLTLAANVPSSATAGAALAGALNLFTNDPKNGAVTIGLSAMPSGATLAFAPGSPSTLSFATSEVDEPAPSVPFSLVNLGNAPGTFTLGAPTDQAFSFTSLGPTTIAPGAAWALTADFTPYDTATATATASVNAAGATCGSSVATVTLAGRGTTGQITGWPTAPIDFGPAACGGAAPAQQSFRLTNVGAVGAHITAVSLAGAPGFNTSAAVGRSIDANGGVLTLTVTAPAAPSLSSLSPITATLSITTDADASPNLVTLTEEPQGAALAFDTSPTPSFGNFGSIVLLESSMQSFRVVNSGNLAADVTLITSTAADAGAAPFTVSSGAFALPPGAAQDDTVTFAPQAATGVVGAIAMSTTSPVCAALPAPVPLTGIGLGGGPVVVPSSFTFPATCGGPAPPSQTFSVSNQGSADFTWTMGALTGPGAALYTVYSASPPGLLAPGQSTAVTVSAASVASPAANPDPDGLAASLTITTDVPLDPPHVVSLGEVPVGDQLTVSVPSLRFGQPPIGMTLSQSFVLTNEANPGSPAASVSLGVVGTGAAAYQVTPSTAASVAPGGAPGASESVSFTPTSAGAYPASVAFSTTDPLCAPLPAPIVLTGTGAQGKVLVAPTSLAFGTDPHDAQGFVDCGTSGTTGSLTITNVGNASFNVTTLSLGLGASSPYQLSGAAAALPANVPIGGSIALTLTPRPIPSVVQDPNDASPFTDTLTIATDAALDAPHVVPLVMQARGAVVASTPLSTTWAFGNLGFGSIGTITSTIRNTGNAPASVALGGLAQPSIFGLQSNPTVAAANAVTSIVGQFVPPAADGAWSDEGTLTVSAEALCAPLPTEWSSPVIALSGSSNGSGAVAVTGDLAFPTTSCGAPPPSGQAITLSNTTDVPYSYSVAFQSGAFYALTDPGPGVVPANGTVSLVVTPQAVTPGTGVAAGSAPYADALEVTVATTPPTRIVVPISWALSGAVLSLPQGGGPDTDASGHAYYTADSTSGFSLPMQNSGDATVTVDFAMTPSGVVQLEPSSPFQLIPGIPTTPSLVSGAGTATCPATTIGALTFVYGGPVCQPFPLVSLTVHSCQGTQ